MRIAAGLAAVAALLCAAPTMAQDGDALSQLIRDNSWRVEASPSGLSGPGAARIVDWSKDAQFFLLGENHGSAGIARFATGVAKALGPEGFRHTVVEADPLVTDRMVALLKQGGMPAFANWLATDQRQRAVPFFAWREEADFAVAALANGPVWASTRVSWRLRMSISTRSPRRRATAMPWRWRGRWRGRRARM